MVSIAVINEMNVYEDKKNIYENPLKFDSFEEAIIVVQRFVEQGYRVAISNDTLQ